MSKHVCVLFSARDGRFHEWIQEVPMSLSTITPAEFSQLLKAGRRIELIDVRTPAEFREVHLQVATNVPLDRLDPKSVMASRDGSGAVPLYVVCKGGSRGKQACEKFIAAGFTNVINIEGGTEACVAAGLSVVRGKKAISLERQVRIAAGLLILIGSALGAFVDPRWIGLAAFVGAGLVFAGVTDTCGMAMLLGRMPWNQVRDGAACSSR